MLMFCTGLHWRWDDIISCGAAVLICCRLLTWKLVMEVFIIVHLPWFVEEVDVELSIFSGHREESHLLLGIVPFHQSRFSFSSNHKMTSSQVVLEQGI